MLFNMYEWHLGVILSLYKWKRSPTAIRSASGLHPWIAMQLDDLESLHLIRGKGRGGGELRKDESLEVATFFLDGWNCGCDVRLRVVTKKCFEDSSTKAIIIAFYKY